MSKPKNNEVRRPPRTAPPNATNVHLHQPRPEKLRTAGLHAIADTAKSYGSRASTTAQQHTNERLAIVTSTVPWCNSTTPRNYAGAELTRPPARTNIGHAHQLPSRIGAHLFHPCGRVTTLDGQTVKAAP